MTIRVTHAAGDMFAPTKRRQQMYSTIAGTGADVITFSEAAKDHAYLQSLHGYECVLVSELAILWRPDTMEKIDGPWWAKVMQGGRLGPLGGRRKDRRGPSRYAVVVALREKATGDVWLPATHHAIAKADTSFLWRRSLRAEGFDGFAGQIVKARAVIKEGFTVGTGDLNTKGGVNLGIGLRELPTPATFGRLRYDRIQVDPSVQYSGLRTFETVLDHDAVTVLLTAVGSPTATAGGRPTTPAPAKPAPKPKPTLTAWQRRRLARLERIARPGGRRLRKFQRRALARLRSIVRRNR